MENSLISVIVPIYNTARYLPRCIESILNQNHRNIELILIDDGSIDDSLNICRQYEKADARIKVLVKPNGGQGSARNMALDIATGDYISFVDSDDYLVPDAYEKMLNTMKESNADLAVCFLGIDEGNGPVHQKYSFEGTRELSNEELMREYVSTPNIHTGPCNKLYKKKLWEVLRFPETRANEDALILHEVLAGANKAVHMGEALYIALIRQGSTEHSHITAHKIECLIKAAENLVCFYERNYPELFGIVAYKIVNDSAGLLRSIYMECSFVKNRGHIKELRKKIEQEAIVANNKIHSEQGISSAARKAMRNHGLFVAESLILGFRRRLSAIRRKYFKK